MLTDEADLGKDMQAVKSAHHTANSGWRNDGKWFRDDQRQNTAEQKQVSVEEAVASVVNRLNS